MTVIDVIQEAEKEEEKAKDAAVPGDRDRETGTFAVEKFHEPGFRC